MDAYSLYRSLIYFYVLLCLEEWCVKCEIQSLSVAPSNSSVLEGESIILKCHVSNQIGQVQWSKNGEMFGFKRSDIPNFPHYEILGNASLGIHNLKIIDARLEDEADYECQVGPAEGQEAIVGEAYVTVIIQPSSIQIMERENGSKLQVKVHDTIALECKVKGGKPAPEIRWFRNSFQLPEEQSKSSVSDEDGGKQTIKSTLEINPNPDDNKAHYSCETYSPYDLAKLKIYVILDVLYPPGKPVIEGYRTNEKMRAGDSVKMKCVSYGGNPLARLVWTKNEEIVDHSYTTSDWEAINEIFFTASASDDGATYTCNASNILTPEPFTKSVSLQVLYAPESITIKAPKEAKPGDMITATCKTEPSNPASEVTWIIDGAEVISDSEVKAGSKGGFVTTSIINVNVTHQDRNKVFTCYSMNTELGETIHLSHTVSVLYAPSPPTIYGYEEGTAIHAGKLQRLTCTSHGGNPLPELKWFKGEEELDFSQSSSTGTVVTKEVTIVTAASDNSAQYQCKSSSKAISEPLIANITLTVYFPPTLPTIKIKPKKPKAGSRIRLTCQCSSSNPAANITWWHIGEKDEVLGASDTVFTEAGDHEGFNSKSTLEINVTAEDDGTKYICQATNEAIQQSSHDGVVLTVSYKPIFKISDQTVFEVKENDSIVIDITAKGNPDEITYKWMKDDKILIESSIFNITSAERSNSGRYVFFAKNDIGESSVTVVIRVLYPMKIIRSADETEEVVIADPHSNVKLECRADGYPIPEDAITWSYGDSTIEEQTEIITAADGKSILKVKNVTKDIAGAYKCKANNGIGSEDSWKIILLIKHQPYIKELDTYRTIFSDRGKTVKLECKAEGVPEVTFKWTAEGVPFPEGKIEVTKLDHFMWKSVLTIIDVNVKDFQDYNCIARNHIGFDTAKINLLPDSSPDPPALVKVTNITKDSLYIMWVPGFSGGHNQTYRIRYKAIVDPVASYQDVDPSAANATWIRYLKSDTVYELAMMSLNAKGPSPYTTDKIKVKTLEVSQTGYVVNDDGFSIEGSLVEILLSTLGTVFLFLLIFNIVLMALYYRKKKPKTKRKYSEDYTSSSSDVAYSSRVESDETSFSNITSDVRESEDRISSHSFQSRYSDNKSTSYESSEELTSENNNEEYSSESVSWLANQPSQFI